jgi:iron complex outermembrane recepter protein
MSGKKKLKWIVVATGALVLPLASHAQVKSEQELPEVKVKAGSEPPRSVVPATASTATKTETPVSEIPQSIQIVPYEIIKDQAAYSLDTAVRNVSGVAQSSSSNYGFFNNYLVRGLNVNFLRDGVPDALTINGYPRTLTDIEHVEVLKGPGSALYGSGSPGGTINLVTRKPQFGPATLVEAGYGSFETRRVLLDTTGPLVRDAVAARFIASYAKSNGFRDLSYESTELLPSVVWRANTDNAFRVNLDHRDFKSASDTVGIPFHASGIAALNSPTLITVARDAKLYTPFAHVDQTIDRIAINHEYTPSAAFMLRQNFVYLGRNLDLLRNASGVNFTSAATLAGRALREQSDDAGELVYQVEPIWKLRAGNVQHTVLTGFEYHRTDIDARRSQSNLAPIANVFAPMIPEQSRDALLFSPVFDRNLVADQFGLYAQDQIKLSEAWQVRVGLRADRFRIEDKGTFNTRFDTGTAFTTTLASNGQSFVPNAPILTFESASRTDTRLSAQAGLVYQVSPLTSFYAGASRGNQAIVTTEAARSAFAPEHSVQYELGNRTYLLDDRLYFNTAVFEVTRSDFLQTINGVPTPVGEQRTRGLEFDVAAELGAGLRALASYAYQDAHYTELHSGTGVRDPNTGRFVVGVPRNSGALWATYEFPGEAHGWGIGAGLQAKEGIFIDQANTQRVPGYVTGEIAVFYRQPRYELQVNVTNVTNATWYRNGVNSGAFPGEPRAVFATLRLKL